MRKVFSSNSQLCHIWAQQNQSEGRGNNMYFRGTDIFSYGEHYLAARIHTVKGKKIALVNSHRYSSSTGNHLNEIRNALNKLMPQFSVVDVTNVKIASKELDQRASDSITRALKTNKVSYKEQIEYALENIVDAYKDASTLRVLLGKKPIKPKASDLAKVKEHYAKRFKRYQELNTPEMLAKRSAEKIKRDEKKRIEREKLAELKRAEYELKKTESLAKFRNGEPVLVDHVDFELLQIRGDIVRTSRGAEVPLKDAITLYRAIESGKNVLGATVGEFTVVSIQNIENDKIVKIGCHEILLSEAKQVLSLKVAA